jgi:hypothetical protein
MRLIAALILSTLVICGCAKKDATGALTAALTADKAPAERNKFMAYEHQISLEAEENDVRKIADKAEAFCVKDQSNGCAVLDLNVQSGYSLSARLKIRAKPESVRALIKVISTDSEVVSQSTHAEDLAKPIADSTKHLEMLKDYRTRLSDLYNKARTDVDSLIKLSKELAAVQSEIESTAGENAYLLQRVNTEILTINIDSRRTHNFWKPIVSSISDFSTSLSNGISGAITAVAYLIPWLVVIFGAGWGARWIWRLRLKSIRTKE